MGSWDDWDNEESTLIQRVIPVDDTVDLDPVLVVLTGQTVGRLVRLDGKMRLGRSAHVDIQLDQDGVSRVHAMVEVLDNGLVRIEDLGSTNGTWVEGIRIDRPMALGDGARIRVGSGAYLRFGYRDRLEQQVHDHLYSSATRDWLTGLLNRRSLTERLHQELAWHRRQEQPLGLVLIDIDHFKQVNDTHGHAAGDEVLRQIATICERRCRTEDVVARVGGEEFCVVLRRATLDDACRLAERLRAAVKDHRFGVDGSTVRCTISAGVVSAAGDGLTDPDDLLARADALLYDAKRAGRDKVVS